MNRYPTKRPGGRGSKSAGKKGSSAIAGRSRATPPAIYVRVPQASDWHPFAYARAHLRNRKGYVYLTWREGSEKPSSRCSNICRADLRTLTIVKRIQGFRYKLSLERLQEK